MGHVLSGHQASHFFVTFLGPGDSEFANPWCKEAAHCFWGKDRGEKGALGDLEGKECWRNLGLGGLLSLSWQCPKGWSDSVGMDGWMMYLGRLDPGSVILTSSKSPKPLSWLGSGGY